METRIRGRLALVALCSLGLLASACDWPPIVEPVTPPTPTRVTTGPAQVGGTLECGGSMTCGPGTALVGELDGSACNTVSQGFCSTLTAVASDNKVVSGLHTANCTALPFFGCGQRAQCPDGKVLVGYSDGADCGLPNSGQCCELYTDVGNRQVVPSGCTSGAPVSCGGTSQCAAGQVMVGRLDGTACRIANQITCCGLAMK